MSIDNPDHSKCDPDKAMRGTLRPGQSKIRWREMTPEESAEHDRQWEEMTRKRRAGDFRWINIPNNKSQSLCEIIDENAKAALEMQSGDNSVSELMKRICQQRT